MIKRLNIALAAAVLGLVVAGCTISITPEEAQGIPPARTDQQRPTPSPVSQPTPVPNRPAVPSFALGEVLVYNCDGGRLRVEYTSNDSARIFADGWQDLTRTTSRDGWFVYKDSNHEWYAQGRQGLLRRDGKDLMTGCRL